MINKTAFVFPGQGSQQVGMLSEIAAAFPMVLDTFAAASTVLNYDLWQLVQAGTSEQLDQTAVTQPAVLTAGYALWQVIQQHKKITPDFLAGHSLGEYTALVCADSLDFLDAVKIVELRGELMQAAVPEGKGAMAAIIGLTDAEVIELCETCKEHEVLMPANYNSIGQVVIAGDKAAVERALQLAKTKGAKMAVLIPVSVPSHCTLMTGAARQFAEVLKKTEFRKPKIPVINNVDVIIYQNQTDMIDGLTRQLSHPVRWVEIIQRLKSFGVDTIIECGPGKILTGLNKRIDKTINLINVSEINSLNEYLKMI